MEKKQKRSSVGRTVVRRTLTLATLVGVLAASAMAYAIITNGEPALDVIGQQDFTTGSQGSGSSGLDHPSGAVLDSTHHRLFVADTVNNRVVIYNLNTDNTLPDKVADNVLGQADFTTVNRNHGSGYSNPACNVGDSVTGPCGLYAPRALAYDAGNDRLFVADDSNYRVLVFSLSGGLSNGLAASNVLGQPNFIADGPNTIFGWSNPVCIELNWSCGSCGLRSARGLAYDATGSRLFVGDDENNRVMIWNLSGSVTDGMMPSNVLGQTALASLCRVNMNGSNTPSAGGFGAGLNHPSGVAYDTGSQRLFVADSRNHRVLVFDGTSISNGVSATHVLGQPSFGYNQPNHGSVFANGACNTGDGTPNSCGLLVPNGLTHDAANSRLFVADSNNNRVLAFSVSSVANGQAATHVLGQPSFSTNTFGGITQSSILLQGAATAGLTYDATNKRLYVADNVSRVLVFDASTPPPTPPVSGGTSAPPDTSVVGSVKYTITQTVSPGTGNVYTMTVPTGTTFNGNVTVSSNGSSPTIVMNVTMPVGMTKSVSLPKGSGNNVCIKDFPGATFTGATSCSGGTNVQLPNAGQCKSASVNGNATDGSHNVTICRSAGTTNIVTVSLLKHSAVGMMGDDDNDGVSDDIDHCPGSVLLAPDPQTRPNHMDDSQVLLGCTRSQILECKSGNNIGERRFGLTLGSRDIFNSKTSANPRGWANQCNQLYPNP